MKIKMCLDVTGKWNLLPAYREHLKHTLRRAEAVMDENILWLAVHLIRRSVCRMEKYNKVVQFGHISAVVDLI